MSHTHPLAVSNATRFRPGSFRGHHRTSSRSPIRKSLFLAKEIDPFLSNLSPDSTLRALRRTSTIDASAAGQDVLARSIADASQEEREIGIRAALTAQKLKQWRQELEHWPWPSTRDRRSGAGFILPQRPSVPSLVVLSNTHMGCLPADSVKQYTDRIEDIRDGVEALELEDIKGHIFSNYATPASATRVDDGSEVQPHFGTLRDFTALITATIVQALPDMLQVNLLLDTWEVRLTVLRQVAGIEADLKFLRHGIDTAKAAIRNEDNAISMDIEEIEHRRRTLGQKVSAVGARIDKLLDLLEGQEDTLPKVWIDSLETVEDDYAAWLDEADHVVARKHLSARTITKQPSIQIHGPDCAEKPMSPDLTADILVPANVTDIVPDIDEVSPLAELPQRQTFTFPMSKKIPESTLHSRRPSLIIKSGPNGHRRDVSEISVADSALSGISDLSNAEIVDARSTVLLSPKISVVENPFRLSSEGMAWLMIDPNEATTDSAPPVLHRASTASVQVISKDSVRPITVIRSPSVDMLSSLRISPPSTPSRALMQLEGQESPRSSAEFEQVLDGSRMTLSPKRRKSSMSRHPSLMVEPLSTRAKENYNREGELPPLPRRSSKRTARSDSSDSIAQSSPSDLAEPETPIENDDVDPLVVDETYTPQQAEYSAKSLTLEDKIKDILTTIPTRIRLENNPGQRDTFQALSTSSTRSSTPVPTLTLSPAKIDRTSRKSASGDIRLFHLTRSGQSKDAAPVKLFVRSVGEHGERVMVRVGGGWADLAEYLREYSLHHGSRGFATSQLEIAPLTPSPTDKLPPTAITPVAILPESSKTTTPKRKSSLSSLSNLAAGRSRRNSRSQPVVANEETTEIAGPPPVPALPTSFASAFAVSSARKENHSSQGQDLPTSNGVASLHIDTSKVLNVVTTPTSSTLYTPMGAAGPNSGASRRAASYNLLRGDNEAWVEGMVDKARAVSGGISTPSNNLIGSKKTASKPGQSGRRLFSTGSHVQQAYSPSSSPVSTPSGAATLSRSKSRLGFGDVGSIKRVFLRRKSEKT